MAEKITFTSWDFIELICEEHRNELSLELRKQIPVYVCCNEGCLTQIPASVYEKILSDIVLKINSNELAVGGIWRKKFSGTTYEFKVITYTLGKKTRIAVKCLR